MSDKPWKVGNTTYEGFPLYLRLPININYDEKSKLYPSQLIVAHHLEKVKENGLPEAEYNDLLENFDVFLSSYLESNDKGLTVLIETYAGKRTYYMYSERSLNLNLFKDEVKNKFPNEKLEWQTREDPKWIFIKRYSKDFGF